MSLHSSLAGFSIRFLGDLGQDTLSATVSAALQAMQQCHVYFEFSHVSSSEKKKQLEPFGFSLLPLNALVKSSDVLFVDTSTSSSPSMPSRSLQQTFKFLGDGLHKLNVFKFTKDEHALASEPRQHYNYLFVLSVFVCVAHIALFSAELDRLQKSGETLSIQTRLKSVCLSDNLHHQNLLLWQQPSSEHSLTASLQLMLRSNDDITMSTQIDHNATDGHQLQLLVVTEENDKPNTGRDDHNTAQTLV